jgi:radical SAM superfamily enzyme YgiQ (UPF0313 family)
MNIILINPNRVKSPPVPPLGLEYIAGSLERDGHRTQIIDLCFSGDIYKDLDIAVNHFSPDIAGITIRNVDSVLYQDNEFYLTDIREIVHYLKSTHGLKVLLGGTGLMSNPQAVLEYLDADYAFVGPAEEDLHGCLMKLGNSLPAERIYYGRCKPGFPCQRRSSSIDYEKYYKKRYSGTRPKRVQFFLRLLP